MQSAVVRTNNGETRRADSDKDVEGPEEGVENQTKDEAEDNKNSLAARELLLILLCNRSLAHLK